MVNRRKRQILDWEEVMCDVHRGQSKPPRAQPRQTTEILECRWEGCGKVCKNKTGLVHHERLMHQAKGTKFECPKCKQAFGTKSSLTNHSKACGSSPEGVERNQYSGKLKKKKHCETCGKEITLSNMARHMASIHAM